MAGRAKPQHLRCGAKTRLGRPCIRRPVPGKKRCPNHGGLSTGPRTPEGKARTLAALRRGWLAWRHNQVADLEVVTKDLSNGAPSWIQERIAKSTSAGPSAEVAAGIRARRAKAS